MTDVNTNDNISTHLVRAYIERNVSQKTGNLYYQLVTIWARPNDKTYTYKSFLNDEQRALLEDTISLDNSSNSVL